MAQSPEAKRKRDEYNRAYEKVRAPRSWTSQVESRVLGTTPNLHRQSAKERQRLALLYPYPEGVERPTKRSDCQGGVRPCPFVSCRYHLYLDVSKTGNVRLNFGDVDPDEIPRSCVLDVADEGGAVLETVGRLMNLTRERVRQIEANALNKAAEDPRAIELTED